MGLLANIGLVDYEVLASPLLSQQHTWVVTSQLWRGHTESELFVLGAEKIVSVDIHCVITLLFCEVCVK